MINSDNAPEEKKKRKSTGPKEKKPSKQARYAAGPLSGEGVKNRSFVASDEVWDKALARAKSEGDNNMSGILRELLLGYAAGYYKRPAMVISLDFTDVVSEPPPFEVEII